MQQKQVTVSLGWREWLSLPQLGIGCIKCKIDTGARTSALHTQWIRQERVQGEPILHFAVQAGYRSQLSVYTCSAPIVDQRWVTDSGGHREYRWVIYTSVQLGDRVHGIEITLANRASMRFKMLLGRTGMPLGSVVHPHLSYQLGKQAQKRA